MSSKAWLSIEREIDADGIRYCWTVDAEDGSTLASARHFETRADALNDGATEARASGYNTIGVRYFDLRNGKRMKGDDHASL